MDVGRMAEYFIAITIIISRAVALFWMRFTYTYTEIVLRNYQLAVKLYSATPRKDDGTTTATTAVTQQQQQYKQQQQKPHTVTNQQSSPYVIPPTLSPISSHPHM